jgi:hypothetical protein
MGKGDLVRAAEQFELSRHVGAEPSNGYWQELSALGQAVVDGERDETAAAREKLETVVGPPGKRPHTANVTMGLHELGVVLLQAGDLPGARQALEEALAIRVELAEDLRAQRTRLSLAALELEEGHAAPAEKLLRDLLPRLTGWNLPDDEALALSLLGRALVEQGKQAEAETALREAQQKAASTESPRLRFELAATADVVLARSADPVVRARTRAALEDARKDAEQRGYRWFTRRHAEHTP